MRIIGIDPGIGRTGWGIVRLEHTKPMVEAYGCIETAKECEVSERLEQIYVQLHDVIKQYKPDAFSIEELFFNTNAKTALIVGQARGVLLLVARQSHIPIFSYTPLQVKIAVAGYGRADKKQVGQMMKTVLQLSTIPTPDDTADALAIALTHAFSYKMK